MRNHDSFLLPHLAALKKGQNVRSTYWETRGATGITQEGRLAGALAFVPSQRLQLWQLGTFRNKILDRLKRHGLIASRHWHDEDSLFGDARCFCRFEGSVE
jgi:hypothetical protein